MTNQGNGKAASLRTDDPEWQLVESRTLDFAAPENPLDWYVLTETTNSLLNELIAYTSRERRREMKQMQPDPAKIKILEELFAEVHGVNSDPENFKRLARMKAIIGRYAPKLNAITDVA